MPTRRDGSNVQCSKCPGAKDAKTYSRSQGFKGYVQQGSRMGGKGAHGFILGFERKERMKRRRIVRPTRAMWLLSFLLIVVDHEQGTRSEAWWPHYYI